MSKKFPQRIQNIVQNEPKSNTKFHIRNESFQDGLGFVLGLSWVVLGSILATKIMKINICFKNGFVEITCLKKMRLGKPFWTELGSIWVPQRLLKGSQIDAKISQNRIKKRSKNKIGLDRS